MSPIRQVDHLILRGLIGAMLAWPLSLPAKDVIETNGNLFLKEDDGTIQQLTTQGIDYHPSLSWRWQDRCVRAPRTSC